MIQRHSVDPAISIFFSSRIAEIKRLEGEMNIAFGILAKERKMPDAVTLLEASEGVIVVNEPEQQDEQSD